MLLFFTGRLYAKCQDCLRKAINRDFSLRNQKDYSNNLSGNMAVGTLVWIKKT